MRTLWQRRRGISIHAPRGGSDTGSAILADTFQTFQSTLPVGGATFSANRAVIVHNISIHAPRGGSDCTGMVIKAPSEISIHAPRGGSDLMDEAKKPAEKISIHAPRGGSDLCLALV